MSNYNVTRFFRGARHSLKNREGAPLVFFKKTLIILEKIIFFIILTKIFSRWKINIQSIFGQHKILYKKIKKNLIFEIL